MSKQQLCMSGARQASLGLHTVASDMHMCCCCLEARTWLILSCSDLSSLVLLSAAAFQCRASWWRGTCWTPGSKALWQLPQAVPRQNWLLCTKALPSSVSLLHNTIDRLLCLDARILWQCVLRVTCLIRKKPFCK